MQVSNVSSLTATPSQLYSTPKRISIKSYRSNSGFRDRYLDVDNERNISSYCLSRQTPKGDNNECFVSTPQTNFVSIYIATPNAICNDPLYDQRNSNSVFDSRKKFGTSTTPTHGLSITPYEKRVAELDMIRRKRREEKEKQQLKNQEYAVSQILQIPTSRNYPLDKQPKQPSILFDKLKIRPKPLSLQNPKCELTPVVILPSTSSSRNFDTVSSTNTLVEMMTNPSSDQDQFVLSVPTSTPKDVVRQEDQIRTTKTVYQYDNKTEQCLTPAKNLPKQGHNSFSQNISIHYNVTPKKTSNITLPSSNSFPTTRVQTNTARSMKKKKIILKPKYTIKSSVHKESYSKTNNSYSLSRKRNIDTGSSSSSSYSSSSSSSSEGEDNFHELRIYKDKGYDEPVLTDSMHKCDVSTPIGYNSKVFSEGQKFNKSISTCSTNISDCSILRTGLFEENPSRSQVSLFSCTPLSQLENTAKRLQSPRTYQHESNTMIRKRARSAILSNLSPRFGDKLFNESKYDS